MRTCKSCNSKDSVKKHVHNHENGRYYRYEKCEACGSILNLCGVCMGAGQVPVPDDFFIGEKLECPECLGVGR